MEFKPDVVTMFTSQSGVIAFFTLLFPGFFATFLYDLRIPGERRNFSDLGIAIVGFSVLIDAPALVWLQFWPLHACDPVVTGIFILSAAIVLPGLAGWFSPNLRHFLANRGLALAPDPKAWDAVFSTLAREQKIVEMKISMTNDEIVYAIWGEGPYASSYPADEDLFLTVPCTLSETGKWTRVADSAGILLSRKDIRKIEMFKFGTFADLIPPETSTKPGAVPL